MRVAFTMIGGGRWTGGENYLRNMLAVMASRLAGEVVPVLFLTPQENEAAGASLAALLPEPPVVAASVAVFGRGRGLRDAVLTGRDRAAAMAFAAARCDVAFESAQFYGWRLPFPTVAWMPDFQHRHMPEMFPRSGWLRREAGFRAQVASGRTIMLSSETAREDAERFFPGARGKTAVVRFAQSLDIADLIADRADLVARYALPQRFVFLPNQFWKHKNHALVVAALVRAAGAGMAHRLPLIVMSGRQDDVRNPGAYQAFVGQLEAAGVADRIRHLGMIAYRDVLRLVAAADAMLNPSFFEGWSTTVEEAKALGTPLLVSDIAIHREQAPAATFFSPQDPAALMERLLALAAGPPRLPQALPSLVAAQEARLADYAAALRNVFSAATAGHPRHA